MNHINQITRILNAIFDIDNININIIAVENDILIIDFSYNDERVLQSLYNKLPGGYLATNPEIRAGELSFTLTEPDNDEEKPQNTTIIAFAYPDED